MSSEANKKVIADAFQKWIEGDGAAFFRTLDSDVKWRIIGTTDLSKTYQSKKQFMDEAIIPLSAKLAGPVVPTLVNLFADGDHVILQWEGSATMKSGAPYQNSYCWVMRMANGKVTEATAYLDTEIVSALF